MGRYVSALSALLLFYISLSTGQRITTIQLDGVQYFVSRMNPYSPELNYFLAYQYCRSLGLQLASFETKEKADSITQYLKNAGYDKFDFWTSGNRLGTDMFLWMSTGLPFNATFNYMRKPENDEENSASADIISGSTSPQRTARERKLKPPVTTTQQPTTITTITTSTTTTTENHKYNFVRLSSFRNKLRLTTQASKKSDHRRDDPVILPYRELDLEQSTNGPYDNLNSHAELQDDPSVGEDQGQENYASTIEPEKTTIIFENPSN